MHQSVGRQRACTERKRRQSAAEHPQDASERGQADTKKDRSKDRSKSGAKAPLPYIYLLEIIVAAKTAVFARPQQEKTQFSGGREKNRKTLAIGFSM
jgi:hypothetical protein